MDLRLRSNEASRPFPRKPFGRRAFALWPALAQSLQPAWGCSDFAALATAQIPRRRPPFNFQTGS